MAGATIAYAAAEKLPLTGRFRAHGRAWRVPLALVPASAPTPTAHAGTSGSCGVTTEPKARKQEFLVRHAFPSYDAPAPGDDAQAGVALAGQGAW